MLYPVKTSRLFTKISAWGTHRHSAWHMTVMHANSMTGQAACRSPNMANHRAAGARESADSAVVAPGDKGLPHQVSQGPYPSKDKMPATSRHHAFRRAGSRCIERLSSVFSPLLGSPHWGQASHK